LYTVYVLYSKSSDKIYIGYTSDMEARLESHNRLATKGWTVRYRPWSLVYEEKYTEKQEALKREKQLKSYQGRKYIRRMLENQPV
jgi:putative endonuclease